MIGNTIWVRPGRQDQVGEEITRNCKGRSYIEISVRARSGSINSSSVDPKDLVSGNGLTPGSVAKSRMTMIGAAEGSVSLNAAGVGSPVSGVVSALAGVFDSFPMLGGPSPSLSRRVATVFSRRSNLGKLLDY